MAVPGGPAAFMSYVRFNDQHDDGRLSQFRERLAAEVRAQTGQEFAIFQDRNDIAWGQNWQQRIDEALDAVTLLLVIITPGLFRSPPCRAEVDRFLDRERALGREDLILPVYYISARQLDDPALRESDEMAAVLAARQFADWRELRFEPFTSPRGPQGDRAAGVPDAGHVLAAACRAGTPGRAQDGCPDQRQVRQSGQAPRVQVTAKTEPPTHVVDVFLGGAGLHHGERGDRGGEAR